MGWEGTTMGRVAKLGVGVAIAVVVGLAFSVALAGPSKDATYIGTKKCKPCHFKQYKTWKKMKHAVTFAVLSDEEKEDPECFGCHVTGYGKAGGFKSLDETPHMVNVGCESCHGPGSEHKEAAEEDEDEEKTRSKINRVPQNACIQCHNPHVSFKELARERAKE